MSEPALAPSATNDIPYGKPFQGKPNPTNPPSETTLAPPEPKAEDVTPDEPAPTPVEPPAEPVETPVEPKEPSPDDDGEEPLPDETPKGVKAAITRAKNRQRAAEKMLAEREADNRRLMAILERGGNQNTTTQAQPQAIADPEPTPESFNGDQNAYGRALFDWSVRRAVAVETDKVRQQDAARREAEDEAKMNALYAQKVAKAREKYDDFTAVAGNPILYINKQMANVIRQSDVGPEVHYYLGKHPELAEQIAGMDAARAGFELGRIEAQLRQPVAPRAVSAAPPPVKPVASGPSVSKRIEEMSMEEYAAHRAAERRAGRG